MTESKRLVSLDAYRGLTIAGMISGGLGLRHLLEHPVLGPVARQFLHTDWHGITFYDTVFPSFLFIVGVALPFSFAKRRSEGQTDRQILVHAVKRAAILFLLGSLRTSADQGRPLLFELSSALQPIAVAYLAASFLLARSIKFRIGVSAALIGVYWLVLELVPAPGIAAGTLVKNANLVSYVDTLLLGRAHADGWGTLLLFLPQIANLLCGTIAGDILQGPRSDNRKLEALGIAAVSLMALGLLLDPVMPIIMKIWTPSYISFTIGVGFLFMLVFFWIIDVGGRRKWAFPLVVFGMNPIALYMANSLFGGELGSIVGVFVKPWVGYLGQAGPTVRFWIILAVKWSIFYWLYRRRIFIKI